MTTMDRLDGLQQRHPQLGFPVAVLRKYSEDQAGNLATLLAYWAFFSLFPLLLVGVTVIGFVGVGDGTFKTVIETFPLVGTGVEAGIGGSPVALVVGIATALWSGTAIFKMTQNAFDSVWDVPRSERRGFGPTLLRSLESLPVLGVGFVVSLALSGIATGGHTIAVSIPLVARLGVGLVTICLDVLGFVVAYRWLTVRDLSFADVLPGATLAGVLFFVLQLGGTALISHAAAGHTGGTGNVATVIGVLWWFSLQSQVVMLGAELNVVRIQRLWPRGLVDPPDTDADLRAAQARLDEQV